MGTSSIYEGPIKWNPLLPRDYNEDATEVPENSVHDTSNDEVDASFEVTWSSVKSSFSKLVKSGVGNSNRRGSSIGHVVRQYVRASGGANGIMSHATSGTRSGRGLHGFFKGISSSGIVKTLEELHIDFQGRSVNEIMSLLVNAISPKVITKEDIVARKATQSALALVYDFIERNNMDTSCLNNMPQELVDASLLAYIESYIWGMMLSNLGSRLEKYEEDPKKALEVEQDLKGYIKGIVLVEFKRDIKIFTNSVADTVSSLLRKCYEILEDVE